MNQGILIAFEGIDGTGKSTQLAMLSGYLRDCGYRILATREPTDGPYGQQIRMLYSNRRTVSPAEELELFLKDREQHVREVIQPALASGTIVLTDRYYFSTAAYQGAAGCDPQHVFRKNDFAPEPDLVLLLTMEPELSIDRIRRLRGEELNDFEQEEHLHKVAALFQSFTHPAIRRINASAPLEKVREMIQDEVDRLLVNSPPGRVNSDIIS